MSLTSTEDIGKAVEGTLREYLNPTVTFSVWKKSEAEGDDSLII